MERIELLKEIVCNPERKIFVEIGTDFGRLTEQILEMNKNITVYCVDPYLSYSDYEDTINEKTGDCVYFNTKKRLEERFGDRVIFIRKKSEDAVHDIPDNIDILYIDGNHKYSYVIKELELYWPKIKESGYIIGDDAIDTDEENRNDEKNVVINYWDCSGHYGVIYAFREFILENDIISAELVGTQFKIKKTGSFTTKQI